MGEAKSKTYLLKSMVLARGLAELSVLVILILLPPGLLLANQFFNLHIIVRVALCILAPLSLIGVWGVGQIPFKLILDNSALSTVALLRRERVEWEKMLTLRQGSKIGFRRYQIKHADGELSFPCMFGKADQLLEEIRARLPNRGRSITGDAQVFRLPLIGFIFELGKLLLQAIFSILFFCFFFSQLKSGSSSKEDLLIVAVAAVAFVASVVWKIVQTFRFPHEIESSPLGLQLKPILGNKEGSRLSWNEIRDLRAAGVLYPDGVFISAGKRNYLLSSGLDGFDELCEEIKQHVKIVKAQG